MYHGTKLFLCSFIFFMLFNNFLLAHSTRNCCAFSININTWNKNIVCMCVAVMVPKALGLNLLVLSGHVITPICQVQKWYVKSWNMIRWSPLECRICLVLLLWWPILLLWWPLLADLIWLSLLLWYMYCMLCIPKAVFSEWRNTEQQQRGHLLTSDHADEILHQPKLKWNLH